MKKFFRSLSKYVNAANGAISQLSLYLLLHILSANEACIAHYHESFNIVSRKGVLLLNSNGLKGMKTECMFIRPFEKLGFAEHDL